MGKGETITLIDRYIYMNGLYVHKLYMHILYIYICTYEIMNIDTKFKRWLYTKDEGTWTVWPIGCGRSGAVPLPNISFNPSNWLLALEIPALGTFLLRTWSSYCVKSATHGCATCVTTLNEYPCEYTILVTQSSQTFKWLQPRCYLTGAAWDNPSNKCIAELNQPMEPWK